MRFLSLLVVAGLILSSALFAGPLEEPSEKLNGLLAKLINKDEKVRQSAVVELSKTEGAELMSTIEWLLVAHNQGMFAQAGKRGYQFVNCTNGYMCGAGWYGGSASYYGGYYNNYGYGYGAEAIKQNKDMVEISKEAAQRSIVAMGPKAIEPLISLYEKREQKSILEILERIADFQEFGKPETQAERASARRQIYTFMSDVYLNKARAAK